MCLTSQLGSRRGDTLRVRGYDPDYCLHWKHIEFAFRLDSLNGAKSFENIFLFVQLCYVKGAK